MPVGNPNKWKIERYELIDNFGLNFLIVWGVGFHCDGGIICIIVAVEWVMKDGSFGLEKYLKIIEFVSDRIRS